MIPSLVAFELRDALVEYLSTTFALSDHETRQRLDQFLRDPEQGIFRGPYLSVRTPFRQVGEGWREDSPLDWLPEPPFTPYLHQAEAFARLASWDTDRDRPRDPQPTLVTTGTGSGKTEAFLVPILDHCAREAARGVRGVKALLLYPMNALAGDQARRLARLLHDDERLAHVTAGLYVGGKGTHRTADRDHLVDVRDVLRERPPDILLTNFKMLDLLLLRQEDRKLWAASGPVAGAADHWHPLRYVVLDEFHTYDGAQGTDVAMLLRRLGSALGLAEPGRPLGRAVPVATSATLGASAQGASTEGAEAQDEEHNEDEAMREFASRVFGTPFESGSVIGERRQTVEEATGVRDHHDQDSPPHERDREVTYPVPDVRQVLEVPAGNLDAMGVLLTRSPGFLDPVLLGKLLPRNPLTRALLMAVSEQPRSWDDAARRVDDALQRLVPDAPRWATGPHDPDLTDDQVHEALARFVGLLSYARRMERVGEEPQPLYTIQVQLWVREVSKLLRQVGPGPARFRWLDSTGATESEDETGAPLGDDHGLLVEPGEPELPSAYCRHCGRAGWMMLVDELEGRPVLDAVEIYRTAPQDRKRVRALIRAAEGEASARHFDPEFRGLVPDPVEGSVPVLVTPSEDAAAKETCPSCDESDAIRFLGSGVPSLASVAISQMFGSETAEAGVADGSEHKLLAFTDSVQDAAHRAGFFSARTYRFNVRTVIASAVAGDERVRLDELGETLLDQAGDSPERLWELTPPDLVDHPRLRTLWEPDETGKLDPDPAARALLADRLEFEATLELGLRSRLGRTLELTGTLAAEVEVKDFGRLVELVAEAHEHVAGQTTLEQAGRPDHAAYLRGLLERLRLQGAIMHPWLEWGNASYVHEDGNPWRIWGGRREGMPAFPPGQRRPAFVTTAKDRSRDGSSSRSPFDSLSGSGTAVTWLTDWARRTTGAETDRARAFNRRVFELLVAEGVLESRRTRTGNTVYGLPLRSVVVHDVPDPDDAHDPHLDADAEAPGAGEHSVLRCTACDCRHVAPPDRLGEWVGTPCLTYRCPGRYEPAPAEPSNYYRRLYRSGKPRRVVTAEHTGLLTREERERLEEAFKTAASPTAPNVIVATPTLELGIDIGDLSSVLLTSMPRGPASYLQRAGRAGRSTGNAFIGAFLPTEPRSLYYLAAPEAMLAGEVRPPGAYLDAIEILRRQYLAFLIGRAAAGAVPAPKRMPNRISDLAADGLLPGAWLRAVLDAGTAPGNPHVEEFLSLFGAHLADGTGAALRDFTLRELVSTVESTIEGWRARYNDLGRRRERLKGTIGRTEARAYLEETEQRDLRRLRGEHGALTNLMGGLRSQPTLAALVELALLPNYTLVDDAATLEATLWFRDGRSGDGEQGGGQRPSIVSERLTYDRPAALALRDFAPGNSFYAHGHRMVIDGLDVGSSTEPAYRWWRLCPECGYGAPEDERERWSTCPRCGRLGIADTGARHLMLELRRVYSVDERDRSRVYDESEQRASCSYHTLTTVDADPAGIQGAWKHRHAAFGMELVRGAVVRTVNLGRSTQPGEQVRVSGEPIPAPRFKTCRHCGAVAGLRGGPDSGGGPDHRGWCEVRSRARREEWDTPVLYHELRTEAVRLLLPVSTFEVAERLASFKGALLLGLRLDFGGTPEHLRVVPTSYPGDGGEGQDHGRRRLLVLHDTVPGGTGYLGRVADPERLGRILAKARREIALCPCGVQGRDGCHRCLLGVVDSHEIGMVSRRLALEILDQLLSEWDFESVATVTSIPIGLVQESELERRFRSALRRWAEVRGPETTITVRPDTLGPETPRPGTLRSSADRSDPDALTALELRIRGASGGAHRYLIQTQVDLDTTPRCRPDYLITRQDEQAPRIAVFLDGYQFHAVGRNNRLADDARKRRAVRGKGLLVWNLTWDDVEQFERAADGGLTREPPDRPLLPPAGQRTARGVRQARGGGTPGALQVDVADHNPMRQLLEFLAQPDLEEWEQVACATVAGLASVAAKDPDKGERWTCAHDRDELLGTTVEPALAGRRGSGGVGTPVDNSLRDLDKPATVVPSHVGGGSGGGRADARVRAGTSAGGGGDGPVYVARWRTEHGLPLTALLDRRPEIGGPNAARWNVIAVLDDRHGHETSGHPERWHAWLRWANVLQFLRTDGRLALLSTTSEASTIDPGALPILPAAAAPASAEASAETIEVAAGAGQVGGGQLGEDVREELNLVLDADARRLVEDVLGHNPTLPVLTAGWEVDADEVIEKGWELEVAWPALRVAVLGAGDRHDERDKWLKDNGWDARRPDEWPADELRAVLEERA